MSICCRCSITYFPAVQCPGDTARALAIDHRNDTATNAFTLIMLVVATKAWQPADPLGAILMSTYIIVTWFKEGTTHVLRLVGKAARWSFPSSHPAPLLCP